MLKEMVKVKRIYCAGPMRGYPLFNFPAFENAAKLLRAMGHHVVSPAEHDLQIGFKPAAYENTDEAPANFNMRNAIMWDLAQVAEGDAIFLLRGWEKSRGASLEKALAEFLDKEIIYE